jgi:hypothetical protein
MIAEGLSTVLRIAILCLDTKANSCGARSTILWPWIHLTFHKRVSALRDHSHGEKKLEDNFEFEWGK